MPVIDTFWVVWSLAAVAWFVIYLLRLDGDEEE